MSVQWHAFENELHLMREATVPLFTGHFANYGLVELLPFLVKSCSFIQQALAKHRPCDSRLQRGVKRVPALKGLPVLWGGWTSDQL